MSENLRYIVAYPNPDKTSSSHYWCNKDIYWYEWEAKRAAKLIGGWVIPVSLEPSTDLGNKANFDLKLISSELLLKSLLQAGL